MTKVRESEFHWAMWTSHACASPKIQYPLRISKLA
jgi:hypothetical protein